jgi:hypothetical protein
VIEFGSSYTVVTTASPLRDCNEDDRMVIASSSMGIELEFHACTIPVVIYCDVAQQ